MSDKDWGLMAIEHLDAAAAKRSKPEEALVEAVVAVGLAITGLSVKVGELVDLQRKAYEVQCIDLKQRTGVCLGGVGCDEDEAVVTSDASLDYDEAPVGPVTNMDELREAQVAKDVLGAIQRGMVEDGARYTLKDILEFLDKYNLDGEQIVGYINVGLLTNVDVWPIREAVKWLLREMSDVPVNPWRAWLTELGERCGFEMELVSHFAPKIVFDEDGCHGLSNDHIDPLEGSCDCRPGRCTSCDEAGNEPGTGGHRG